jgi:hypothetical protein
MVWMLLRNARLCTSLSKRAKRIGAGKLKSKSKRLSIKVLRISRNA